MNRMIFVRNSLLVLGITGHVDIFIEVLLLLLVRFICFRPRCALSLFGRLSSICIVFLRSLIDDNLLFLNLQVCLQILIDWISLRWLRLL